MRAVPFNCVGPPDVLEVHELEEPAPEPDEVLVRVEASGVCGQDVLYRRGLFSAPNGKVMGHEIAGTVVAVGSRVAGFKAGDRVAAIQRRYCGQCRYCAAGREVLCQEGMLYGEHLNGGYAQYCALHHLSLARVPSTVSYEEAAIGACAIGTAYHALRLAGTVSGRRVLVTGASGGVGIHALQLAREMGAEVVAVTRSSGMVPHLSRHADRILVAEGADFHREVRDRGLLADVVLDLTAAATLPSSLRSVQRGGAVVIVGNMAADEVGILPGALIAREITLLGSKACSLAELEDVLELIGSGQIRPEIHAVLPLEQVVDAHRLVQSGAAAGRVVLRPWGREE